MENKNQSTGTLSIVATPIGNLQDITFRAIETLRRADLILCEDTRVTKKILSSYGMQNPTQSFHTHSHDAKLNKIIENLRQGMHIAYVSDAGTPGISDPGPFLVRRVQEMLPEVIIEAIPGPDAVSAALSIAGVVFKNYVFLGFIPQKKGRETFLKSLNSQEYDIFVFFESSHRIKKLMDQLQKHLEVDRSVTLVKEISKIHERVLRGSPAELSLKLEEKPELQKGEFVVIV